MSVKSCQLFIFKYFTLRSCQNSVNSPIFFTYIPQLLTFHFIILALSFSLSLSSISIVTVLPLFWVSTWDPRTWEHDADMTPFALSYTPVDISKAVLHNHNIKIKIKKLLEFVLMQSFYLTCRPNSDFASCPTYIFETMVRELG